jgi:hypothetical protein
MNSFEQAISNRPDLVCMAFVQADEDGEIVKMRFPKQKRSRENSYYMLDIAERQMYDDGFVRCWYYPPRFRPPDYAVRDSDVQTHDGVWAFIPEEHSQKHWYWTYIAYSDGKQLLGNGYCGSSANYFPIEEVKERELKDNPHYDEYSIIFFTEISQESHEAQMSRVLEKMEIEK